MFFLVSVERCFVSRMRDFFLNLPLNILFWKLIFFNVFLLAYNKLIYLLVKILYTAHIYIYIYFFFTIASSAACHNHSSAFCSLFLSIQILYVFFQYPIQSILVHPCIHLWSCFSKKKKNGLLNIKKCLKIPDFHDTFKLDLTLWLYGSFSCFDDSFLQSFSANLWY